MKSSLTNACTIKIQNFEGPFDLMFHLLEKNQLNIYDIPINTITDQYMDYLFAMQTLNLEIASEFLVMAATLLHIKSKLLLPDRHDKQEEEVDPREELVLKLLEYKKYKACSEVLKTREKQWEKVYYKLPEVIDFVKPQTILELSPEELRRTYLEIMERNKRKRNNTAAKMATIIQHEKVSLKSKIRDVLRTLIGKTFFVFSDLFSLRKQSKTEVVTGFLAILELAKLKKIRITQQKQFSEIVIHRNYEYVEDSDIESFSSAGGA